MQQYTIVGVWYGIEHPFVVTAHGADLPDAQLNAAHEMLAQDPCCPESAETFWGGEYGAYVVATFDGDLRPHVYLTPDTEVIV